MALAAPPSCGNGEPIDCFFGPQAIRDVEELKALAYWYMTRHGPGSGPGWSNVGYRAVVRPGFDQASAWSQLTCPLIVLAAVHDEIVSYEKARAAFDKIPSKAKQWQRISGGHFLHLDTDPNDDDPHTGTHSPQFYEAVKIELRWLCERFPL